MEIEPSATEEEVRRATRRLKEIYAPDAPAVYGAYTQAELESLNRRFDEAQAILVDPEKRQVYDLELRVAGAAAAAEKVHPEVEEKPEPPPPDGAAAEEMSKADADYTGDLLQRIRIARRLSLEELADRTKIKPSYLRAIEEEAWDLLPASIYVRGFLANVARELKVDARRVLDTYFQRLRQYYAQKGRE